MSWSKTPGVASGHVPSQHLYQGATETPVQVTRERVLSPTMELSGQTAPRSGRFRTASIGISKTKSKRRQAKQGICRNFPRGLGHSAPEALGFEPDSSLVVSSCRWIKVFTQTAERVAQ